MNGDTKFSQPAIDLISDPANDVLVSAASLWEMQGQDFRLLGIEPQHLLELRSLPRLHGDPWDHSLMAQAIAERAVFMSEDGNTPQYPVTYVTCSDGKPPQRGG